MVEFYAGRSFKKPGPCIAAALVGRKRGRRYGKGFARSILRCSSRQTEAAAIEGTMLLQMKKEYKVRINYIGATIQGISLSKPASKKPAEKMDAYLNQFLRPLGA